MPMLPPVPRVNTLLQAGTQTVEFHWDNWFQQLLNAVNASIQSVAYFRLTDQQSDMFVSAPITSVPLPSGLYRITYTMTITQAASVGSSLHVLFLWTDEGQTAGFAGSIIISNMVGDSQSAVIPLHIDEGTIPEYQLKYGSSGLTPMIYSATIQMERLPAP